MTVQPEETVTTPTRSRRVLLKLSGEVFGGGAVGLDPDVVADAARQIAAAARTGVQVAVVVGGGNFFRGAELSARGMDRARADYMGMLGTVKGHPCPALRRWWWWLWWSTAERWRKCRRQPRRRRWIRWRQRWRKQRRRLECTCGRSMGCSCRRKQRRMGQPGFRRTTFLNKFIHHPAEFSAGSN